MGDLLDLRGPTGGEGYTYRGAQMWVSPDPRGLRTRCGTAGGSGRPTYRGKGRSPAARGPPLCRGAGCFGTQDGIGGPQNRTFCLQAQLCCRN